MRRDGFQTHQQAFAAAARGQFQQFQVISQQNRGQPVPLNFQRHERGKESQSIATVGDEIQIHENEFSRAVLVNVGHHIFDRFLIRLAAPCCRDDAEIAAMNTAARGLKHVIRQKTMAGQKLAARERTVRKIKSGGLVITRLHLAIRKVTEQLRPRIFGIAGDDGVGVWLGVVRDKRHMRPTQHNLNTTLPKVIRQFVGANRRPGDNGQPNEVGIQAERHVGDAFVK